MSDDEDLSTLDGCKRALATNPTSWSALKAKAEIEDSLDLKVDALATFRALAEAHPNQGLGFRRGIEIASELAKWNVVVELCKASEELLSARPFWVNAYRTALKESGRLDTAEKCVLHLSHNPEDSVAALVLADIYRDLADVDAAKEVLLRCTQSEMVLLRRVELAMDLREWQSARLLIDQLSALGASSDAKRVTTLIQLGHLDLASSLCAEVLGGSSTAMWPRLLMCWIHTLEHDWSRLFDCAAGAPQLSRPVLGYLAAAAVALGDTVKFWEIVDQAGLERADVALASALLHEAQGNWREAHDCWRVACADSGDPSRYFQLGLCHMRLREEAQAHHAFEQADKLASSGSWSSLGKAQLLSHFQRYGDAAAAWGRLVESSPGDFSFKLGYVTALGWAGMFELASTCLADLESSVSPGSLDDTKVRLARSSWHRLQYDYPQALATLEEALSTSRVRDDEGKLLAAICELRVAAIAPAPDIERAIESLNSLEPDSPIEVAAVVKGLVAVGMDDAARSRIDAAPSTWDRREKFPLLRSWSAMSKSLVDRAAQIFEVWKQDNYLTAFHANIDDLRPHSAANRFAPHETVLFCCLRDEAVRLPAFLDHYRRLGIENFVMIDNNSTDGTWELMTQEPGVTAYRTADHFITAGSGMRWINHLIDELAPDNWCVFVDADEFLVFENGGSLAEAICALESAGAKGLASFMLDMHPPSSDTPVYAAGADPLSHSSHHAGPYRCANAVIPPYREVRGGFRESILGMPNREMTKAPMLHTGGGARWLTNHSTTPCVFSNEPHSVLLHFKWLVDPIERSEKEHGWAPFSFYAANRAANIEGSRDGRKTTDSYFRASQFDMAEIPMADSRRGGFK